MLWLMANLYPFLSLKVGGLEEQNLLIAGGWALYQQGMGELGLVVFLTSIVFPLLTIIGMLYLLIPLRFNAVPPLVGRIYQLIKWLEPWSLISVFMLGTLIAIVKLQDLANVLPGFSLYAFVALLFIYSLARSSFNPVAFWEKVARHSLTMADIPDQGRLVHCHICDNVQTEVQTQQTEDPLCMRCGCHVHYRIENSLQTTSALLCAATLMLIPANLYPVMTVSQLGSGQPDTIISGIIHLIEGGLWGLGLIVLIASIIVPFAKLISLSYLLYSVQTASTWRPRDRTLLYRATEVIGSWSMVDVFLVGLLTGLVSLGVLANVTPGIGASFFGAAVILTMLAAQAFDPRLIWDHAADQSPETSSMERIQA